MPRLNVTVTPILLLGLGFVACASFLWLTLSEPNVRPVVFFSIAGSLPLRVHEQQATERYVTHKVEVDEAALVVAVPKRVHTDKDVYFSIVQNATQLFHDVVEYGPRFDVDDVGGVVPGTESTEQLAITIVTLASGGANMAKYHLQSASKRGDVFELTLQHDRRASTVSSFGAHADFDIATARHYHTAALDDVSQDLVTGTFETWAIEMYKFSPCQPVYNPGSKYIAVPCN